MLCLGTPQGGTKQTYILYIYFDEGGVGQFLPHALKVRNSWSLLVCEFEQTVSGDEPWVTNYCAI